MRNVGARGIGWFNCIVHQHVIFLKIDWPQTNFKGWSSVCVTSLTNLITTCTYIENWFSSQLSQQFLQFLQFCIFWFKKKTLKKMFYTQMYMYMYTCSLSGKKNKDWAKIHVSLLGNKKCEHFVFILWCFTNVDWIGYSLYYFRSMCHPYKGMFKR